MRYFELFAGAGGMSLGLDRAGMVCVGHAEIEDFPRRVLKRHWPDAPLYGDVCELDGRKLVADHGPIDLISGGSPCQDLSVAGKRSGMVEGSGTRSSLFYEQVRIYNETSAEFCLWENVMGAFSSNKGADFAAVLSAFVGGAVIVPRDGWRNAGVAAGPAGVAAWRVLDAQFFGVPQRRRRVFVLCSRTGRVDPAEVLSLSEGVRGDTAKGRKARQRPSEGAGRCVEGEGGVARVRLFAIAHGEARENDVASCIAANSGPNRHGQGSWSATQLDAIVEGECGVKSLTPWDHQGKRVFDAGGIMPALYAAEKSGQQQQSVLAFSAKDSGADASYELSPTLRAGTHDRSHANGGVMPAVVCTTGEVTHALTSEGHDAGEDGTGRGTPIVAYNETGHEKWSAESVAGSLNAHEAKEAHTISLQTGIPRRLTPRECERLMSWPDGHTNVPDEKGKPASDSVRYRACGNGVVSNCAEWIGRRLLGGQSLTNPRGTE